MVRFARVQSTLIFSRNSFYVLRESFGRTRGAGSRGFVGTSYRMTGGTAEGGRPAQNLLLLAFVARDHTVFDEYDPMRVFGDVVFVGYEDDGVAFGM